ncbi:MAG TPA: aminotransferase class I/II-fold pyridoxal phosphate-dependent enzyme [Acidimicrobiia bacterium]
MAVSKRLQPFGVTIFTEMTELANRFGAINLGQGFPSWDGPDFVKEAATAAMAGGLDQYPPSPGLPALREAVARRYGPLLGRTLDPGTEVTITSGCTEALAASFLGLVDPGDEVILIEPYYDSYPADLVMAGAIPRYVTLRPPDFRLDLDELASVFSPQTRAVMVNTPHNPTGRVFDQGELEGIANLCRRYDAIALCDEVYEELVFESEHLRMAKLEGMWERTVTMSSVGKTFSLTGWKVGWAVAPAALTAGVRAAHQFLTFTTPTPVQAGTAAALGAPPEFYADLRDGYRAKRDLLVGGLRQVGLDAFLPEGTYFVMAGVEGVDGRSFCLRLVEEARVAAIPASAFYHQPGPGDGLVRFAFCKDEATLTEAIARMTYAM